MLGRMLVFAGSAVLSASASQTTVRISVGPGGYQGTGDSSNPSITPDGRFVAYSSQARQIVLDDTNAFGDVYVNDRLNGTTRLASRAWDGSCGNGFSGIDENPPISDDARFVAFTSDASNLVPGDANGKADVFVRDLVLDTIERVSVSTSGEESNGHSFGPCSMSADGRIVAFACAATNFPPYAGANASNIYVRDRRRGTTTLVSVALDGYPTYWYEPCSHPSVSADGRFVAFSSWCDNLAPFDGHSGPDVFVRDLEHGVTEIVSISSTGAAGDGDSQLPAISGDGRYVAFVSQASNLVTGGSNGRYNVFVRDRQTGTTEQISVGAGGAQTSEGEFQFEWPAISRDGVWVAFGSWAPDVVLDDTNGTRDVFLRNRPRGITERISLAANGRQSNGRSCYYFTGPAISADGRFVAFDSLASNLVPEDTNGHEDVFVRDLRSTGFTSVCEPGRDGVATCPCANDPSASGRGCDNSAATGGASLSASGNAYTTQDDLVFTTEGEPDGAASAVFQGGSFVGTGAVYGQGVLCIGGTLTKLYTKTAAGGGIRAPDSTANDLSVSDRSTMLGVGIGPGRTRYYVVAYREPSALPGCAGASLLNVTQTARIDWSR